MSIFWVKLNARTILNLSTVHWCKKPSVEGEPLIYKTANKEQTFYGCEAEIILARLKLLSDPKFMAAYHESQTLSNRIPKKRGCRQKPETLGKLRMLQKGVSVRKIAEHLAEIDSQNARIFISRKVTAKNSPSDSPKPT